MLIIIKNKKRRTITSMSGLDIMGMRSHFRKLAIHIYNLQVIYDPEKIAIGGGISRQPLVLSMIQAGLDEIYEKRPLTVYPVNLVACEFRSDANLIGALHFHMEKNRY